MITRLWTPVSIEIYYMKKNHEFLKRKSLKEKISTPAHRWR